MLPSHNSDNWIHVLTYCSLLAGEEIVVIEIDLTNAYQRMIAAMEFF